MFKYIPNLIDINEVNKEIKNTIFKNTTYRVNIILGLLFIFLVLIFIYFGINKKENEITYNDSYLNNNIDIDRDEEVYDDYDEYDYVTPVEYNTNTYELALMS
jgi:hypothetical protein